MAYIHFKHVIINSNKMANYTCLINFNIENLDMNELKSDMPAIKHRLSLHRHTK